AILIAMAKTTQQKKKILISPSTANTSPSPAAYPPPPRLKPILLIPQPNIPLPKLSQPLIYPPQILSIQPNFHQPLQILQQLPKNPQIPLLNSL
ncbi:PALP domain-containing protein, partial [Staphylococcus saprophyticus]|uniref:hypothetical protein n=1 Tax=Staphylococcus saprophyticus TaxID=29385 RepID=UPI003704714D